MGIIFTHRKPFIPASATIGVSGTDRGVGATHLCIALANFLCGKFCSNTAYLEMNGRQEICSLGQNFRAGTDAMFVCQKVCYYPNMTLAGLAEVLSGHYRYFVLDFGSPNPHTIPAFMGCNIRLVVGSVCPWKAPQYIGYVQNSSYYITAKEDVVYLGNFMERKRDLKELEQRCGMRVIPVPYLPNPFRITSESFAFFEKILGGN